MAKRVDPRHDATQELSTSQLVPDGPRPVIPRGKAPPNDASMWMQTVVSTDDFSPATRKAAPSSRRTLVLGAAIAGALAMAAGTYVIVARSSSTAPAPAIGSAAALDTSAGSANPAEPASAAPAAPEAPAAVVAAPDAGVEAAAVPMEADAVSSVGAPILKKPATKKRMTKKRVTKKPTTTRKPTGR